MWGSDQERKKKREKSEDAISGKQPDSVLKEIHAVSVMMEHLETDAIRDKKGQSSSLAPKALTQTDGKKPSKGSDLRGENISLKGGRISCRIFL